MKVTAVYELVCPLDAVSTELEGWTRLQMVSIYMVVESRAEARGPEGWRTHSRPRLGHTGNLGCPSGWATFREIT